MPQPSPSRSVPRAAPRAPAEPPPSLQVPAKEGSEGSGADSPFRHNGSLTAPLGSPKFAFRSRGLHRELRVLSLREPALTRAHESGRRTIRFSLERREWEWAVDGIRQTSPECAGTRRVSALASRRGKLRCARCTSERRRARTRWCGHSIAWGRRSCGMTAASGNPHRYVTPAVCASQLPRLTATRNPLQAENQVP